MVEGKKPVGTAKDKKGTAVAKAKAQAPARARSTATVKGTGGRPKAAPKPAAKTAPKRAVARPVTRTVVRREAPARAAEAERPAPRPKAEPRPLPTAPAGQVPVIAADGAVAGALALPASLASVKRRGGVLFQAFLAAAANARQANAATRNRSRVRGGGAKPWRQKGTGRARQGSTRAPHWRHGAVAFGPNGRRYEQRLPEKMRHAAFAEAFASRVDEGRVLVFEGLSFDGDRPRTRAVVDWLGRIGDTGKTVIVTPTFEESVARAVANAPGIELRSVGSLRLGDVLTHDTLLVHRDALETLAARATVTGGGS